MTGPAVSVVIVTRHRPDELAKCLRALRLQTYENFELVVVGDPGIAAVLARLGLEDAVKQSLFDEENISVARNRGIALSAGEIIAFIDDDAVAEPTWIERLVAPFEDVRVAAAGGFVRGRNGISFQWRGEAIDTNGQMRALDVSEIAMFPGEAERATKTHGTNCAFRRQVLLELGGFDPNYRFYLEDSDLNMRISQAGHHTALVPHAEVQHGFAPSIRRNAARVPLRLSEIGASHAYFVKKFGGSPESLDMFKAGQRRRLLRHMVSGGLGPEQIPALMRDLSAGIVAGQARQAVVTSVDDASEPFFPLPGPRPAAHKVFYANWFQKRASFAAASRLAKDGESLTLMVFSRTALFHRRWFHPCGFWVQTGGQFGKSRRDDPIFKPYRASKRAAREQKLVSETRRAQNTPLPIATQSP